MKKPFFLILLCFLLFEAFGQSNRIPVLKSDGTPVNIFFSGGNLAWDQFANDFGAGATNFDFFEDVFTQWENAGANSMRLWVHITGEYNPEFDENGKCTGLEASHLVDMQRVLDMAYNHNIVLVLSLWSFDMLNHEDNEAWVIEQSKKILNDEANIQAYIDNALIPMVEAFKDHPAVGAWEIFNEPEGMSNEFGWDKCDHVAMSVIQRFVNRLAGAIHRTDPDAQVTNGTWAFYAGTDILEGNTLYKNYYSDSELIAAGGDAAGTLDFYQIHYYDWMSNDISVMHHPASYWGLDKPILVGEFFPVDAAGISWGTYYDYLYNNGYAGALTWSWSEYSGSYQSNMLTLMSSIKNYPDIVIETGRNHFPYLGEISNGLFDINAGTITNYVDLDDISSDQDGDVLTFTVENNTNPSLVTVTIDANHQVNLAIANNTTGSAKITIKASDPDGLSSSYEFGIVVKKSGTGNLALYRTTVYTSGNETGSSVADPLFATDGDYNTRWSSAYTDPSWYYIDLGQSYDLTSVKLFWETAYGQRYEIQVSNDASTWTTVYTENAGNGGTDEITFASANAQYVRMYGIQRATAWGYSFYEFEVYGSGDIAVTGVTVSPSSTGVVLGSTVTLTATVSPSNAADETVSWSSSNSAIATINSSGVVTGKAVGTAIITATSTDGGFTATSTIEVTVSAIPVTGVTVTPTSTSIEIGTSASFTATVSPSNATNKTLTWSSSNTAIATVSSSGVVLGISEGTVTITATTVSGGYSASSLITIIPVSTPCDNPVSASLPLAQDGAGEYCWSTSGTISNINSWNMDLVEVNGVAFTNKWSSSMPSKVNGLYYIHYKASVSWAHLEVAGSSSIVNVTGVTIAPASASIAVGGTTSLTATVAPTNATNKSVTWSSSNSAIASVSTAGVVTGVGTGSATITVTTVDQSKTATTTITVSSSSTSVTGVSVSPAAASVTVGSTTTLTATVTPTNATNKSVTWSSSNTAIASVSTAGIVTGVGTGSATITVTTVDQSKTATATITVSSSSTSVTGVTVSPTTASVSVGSTTTLLATVTPTNATNKSVIWSSSNTAIASVSTVGVITGVGTGSATITVTTIDQSKTATATITVTSTSTTTCGSSNAVSITIPFSKDGVGEYCYVTTQTMAYVNSWNMDKVTINDVDYTNKWSNSMPAAINGAWYIYYKASVAWAHFEAPAVKNATGIEMSQKADGIKVYPNPFSDEITIESDLDISCIELYNSVGQLIKKVDADNIGSTVFTIDENLQGNQFYLRIITDNQTVVKSLIKK